MKRPGYCCHPAIRMLSPQPFAGCFEIPLMPGRWRMPDATLCWTTSASKNSCNARNNSICALGNNVLASHHCAFRGRNRPRPCNQIAADLQGAKLALELTNACAKAGHGQRPGSMAALRETICSEIVLSCTHEFGATLQAVVLTGSLARDEATVVFKLDLTFFSSDADCLLVFPATIEPSTERLARLSAEIEKGLFTAGIEVAIGLAAVAPTYFDELPAHSYTYELRNSGKVLWGEAGLLSRIPSYKVADLSKEDAWRTLSNRIIETLMCVGNSESESRQFSVETEYAVTKLYLDMATSYLIFIGEYEPTYAARARRLAELAARNAGEAPFIVATFSSRVSSATDCKLKGVGCAPVRLSLEEAMMYSQQLWRWAAARLSGEPSDLPVLDLAVGVARKQTVATRLRGWASLLRRTGWFRGARQWPRWARLSISASPRHLIYAAAVQLFWSVPGLASDQAGNDIDYAELQALLPVVPPSDKPATWNSLVRAVGLNYKVFLHGTLA